MRWIFNQESDGAYLKAVTQRILTYYDGQGPHWHLSPSPQLWPISLGGRAGVVGVRIDNRTCCAKLFYDRRLRTRLRTFWGRAKGQTAYHHALRLQQAGVACPTPLGYAEQRPFGPSLVFTELIEAGQRLDDWITNHRATPAVVEGLAYFIRTLHERGVTHRDLSPRNLLIVTDPPPLRFYILDYEDARFQARVPETARIEDLHHLDERLLDLVTIRHRLRFLRLYAGSDYHRYRQRLGKKIEESQSKYVRAYRDKYKNTLPPHNHD